MEFSRSKNATIVFVNFKNKNRTFLLHKTLIIRQDLKYFIGFLPDGDLIKKESLLLKCLGTETKKVKGTFGRHRSQMIGRTITWSALTSISWTSGAKIEFNFIEIRYFPAMTGRNVTFWGFWWAKATIFPSGPWTSTAWRPLPAS